jgi:hypothetical protein
MDSLYYRDTDPLEPRDFMEKCEVAWARIYIEVASEKKSYDVGWRDISVERVFLSLTGFVPSRYAFADLSTQLASLGRAREVTQALHNADEVFQLDGRPALDFAYGWMAAFDDVLAGVQFTDGNRDAGAQRSRRNYPDADPKAFIDGFIARTRITHPPAVLQVTKEKGKGASRVAKRAPSASKKSTVRREAKKS